MSAEHDATTGTAPSVPVLSVLIVSYEVRGLVRACLRSVYEQTAAVPFEVVLLDNASGDGTAEMVREEFPAVRLIASQENLGFAVGNNRAAREARGEHLALLNPDTVVHDRALERLLDFSRRHPEAGLVGGRTIRPDGSLDPSSCWGAQTLWSLTCFGTGLSTVLRGSRWFDPESIGRWQRDSERRVGVVTGCLLLTAARTWRALGGFDERFFMYGEDADLSRRALALGHTPMITPDATITHVVGASTPDGGKMVNVLRGRATLLHKHHRPFGRAFGLAMLALGVAARASGERLRRRGGGATWTVAWTQRRRWLAGFPPHEPDIGPAAAC